MPSTTPLSATSRPSSSQTIRNAIFTLERRSSSGRTWTRITDGIRPDAYVHAGGQYEWDNCAPVGVALAADLHCSRLDGSPIVYNQPQPYMPDFVICRKEIRDDLLAALDEVW